MRQASARLAHSRSELLRTSSDFTQRAWCARSFDAGERRVQRCGIVAAGLREVRPAAALAADLRRDGADELARLDARDRGPP